MATSHHRTAPDHENEGWPKGVPYIIGNEGCERFSFYGMKAILYIYVVGLFLQLRGMGYEEASREALAATHLFVAGVYFVPLIGGIIADRLLGKYKTIMYLSVVYCLGHLCLALFENSAWQLDLLGKIYIDPLQGLGLGLLLICLGSGGIKPCVSAHVGDQFGKKNWHRLPIIFNAFYFIINFGSTFSTLLIPVIRGPEMWKIGDKLLPLEELTRVTGMSVDQIQHTGTFIGYDGSVGLAFGIPGILMGLATIAFWMGRKVFIHVPASPGGKLGLLDTISGVSLFSVIAYPIFFMDIFGTGWPLTIAISIGFFVLFAVVFSARQRIEQDDGFLAVLFYLLFQKGREAGASQGPEAGADESEATLPTAEGEEPASGSDEEDLARHPFWGAAVRKFGLEATEGPVAVLKIISVFFMVSVFWALFDQHSSTWIEQAKKMNRILDLSLSQWLMFGAFFGTIVAGAIVLSVGKSVVGRAVGVVSGLGVGMLCGWLAHANVPADPGYYEVFASQVPSTNPILVMILIPYTTFGLYPLLARLGWDPKPLRRMTVGMFMASLSFVSVALIQRWLDDGVALHVVWQMIPYTIITLSEVMVSITGLEFAYSQAPKRMKSVIMGFWLFNVTLGSLLVVLLAGFEGLKPEAFFWVFAGLMAGAAVIFGLRARVYKYKDFHQ